MKTKKFLSDVLLIILLSTISIISGAQSSEQLTNTKVIELHKTGIAPSIIVKKIQTSTCNFDLSTNALIQLKSEKVPDEIVNAMMTQQSDPTNVVSSPNEPSSKHEAGIYFMNDSKELIQLEPSICSQGKTGGHIGNIMSRGFAPTTSKATIDGNASRTQLHDSQPVFYFYFEKGNIELGGNWYFNNATNPNEFLLVKTEVRKKTREFVPGTSANYGSMSGVADKFKQEFVFEKIASRIYKVTCKQDLVPGEYCFLYAGSQSPNGIGQKVYDFGIEY
jgi:hypothetical protein